MLSFFCSHSIVLAVISHTQPLGLFLFSVEMDLIWKMKSQVQPVTAGSGKRGISSGNFNRLGCLRSSSGGKCRFLFSTRLDFK